MKTPKPDREFFESLNDNMTTFYMFYDRIMSLALTSIDWKNLPDTCDERFLELCLFSNGSCVFFEDEVMGFLNLNVMYGGKLDVYNNPIEYEAYSTTDYRKKLSKDDSVIIWNNYIKQPSQMDAYIFASRLTNIERTIDVNLNSQKTPVLITCEENQRLTLKNVYEKWSGNEPVIYGKKGLADSPLTVLKTDAPFISDKLYQIKVNYWNEILTYLGIPSVQQNKKERLVSDEVNRMQGGAIANRFSRVNMRQQAAKRINKMFGLDVWPEYREVDSTMPGINFSNETPKEGEK